MAKQAKSTAASKRAPAGKTAASTKSKDPPNGWEWAAFTKKAVAAVAAAKVLDEELKYTYGQSMTITSFEKFVAAYATFSDDQKSIVHVEAGTVALLKQYRQAIAARNAERDSFRGDVKVADVDSGLSALEANFGTAE